MPHRPGAPVDVASLAVFRALFGAMMFAGVVRFAARGWIGALYLEPRHFFTRATAFAFSYAGLCFDLFVVFALCYRRTRPAAYAAVVAFHLLTWALFNIGLFPWVMIVCTVGVLRALVAAALAGNTGVGPPATDACSPSYRRL